MKRNARIIERLVFLENYISSRQAKNNIRINAMPHLGQIQPYEQLAAFIVWLVCLVMWLAN
jgi:hypothetical protein